MRDQEAPPSLVRRTRPPSPTARPRRGSAKAMARSVPSTLVGSTSQWAPPSCVPMMVPAVPAAQPSLWLTHTSARRLASVGRPREANETPSGLDHTAPDLVVSHEPPPPVPPPVPPPLPVLPAPPPVMGAGAGAGLP